MNNTTIDRKQLQTRLDTIYEDINLYNTQAEEILSLIDCTTNDKENLLSSIYFSENSPLKTMHYIYSPGSKGDSTAEMIRVSMNYDLFVNEMSRKAKELITIHNSAIDLFTIILSLPMPYCQLLYFRYYKKYSIDEIRNQLFLSRSSYYRLFDNAISLAMDKIQRGN